MKGWKEKSNDRPSRVVACGTGNLVQASPSQLVVEWCTKKKKREVSRITYYWQIVLLFVNRSHPKLSTDFQ